MPGAGADFLDLPARSGKPRTAGLTHVLDKGLPLPDLRSLLGAVAAHVDLWKFGWGTAYLDPSVEAKTDLLRMHGVLACTGGTLLELAWLQGKQEAFLDWAAGCGFACVEVSNGTVEMDRATKSALISATANRFIVLGEVGSKDPADPVSLGDWVEQSEADLAAGATWVVTEGREGGSVGLYCPDGSIRADLVEGLVSAVGVDRLIFEAPRREQQAWLIKRLGSDVNLGNVATTEILGVETLRLGLRSDTIRVADPAVTRSGEPSSSGRSRN